MASTSVRRTDGPFAEQQRSPTHAAAGAIVVGRAGAPARSTAPQQRLATCIARSTDSLTSSQVQSATELFCHKADGSVDIPDLIDMLDAINLLPPASFNMEDALDSIGASKSNATLEDFLAIVNGVWKAIDEQSSHEALVKNAHEAFTRLQKLRAAADGAHDTSLVGGASMMLGAGFASPPLSNAASMEDPDVQGSMRPGGLFLMSAGRHTSYAGSDALPTPTGLQQPPAHEDPVASIVVSNMNRGLRSLQQFLSPSNGEPEMLRTFLRLGAMQTDSGYVLDIQRMQAKCEVFGMSAQDAATIGDVFDKDCSGEIDFDEYLQVMSKDLTELGLKPKLLDQLRKVLSGNPVAPAPATTSSAAGDHTASNKKLSTAPMKSPSQYPQQGQQVSAASPNSNRGRSFQRSGSLFAGGGHRQSRAMSFVALGEGSGDASHRISPSSGSPHDDEDGEDDFASYSQKGLGRSLLFDSVAYRQASIHEAGDPNALYWLNNPAAFFSKVEDDLLQCRQDLEDLREYEREAARLQKTSFAPKSIFGPMATTAEPLVRKLTHVASQRSFRTATTNGAGEEGGLASSSPKSFTGLSFHTGDGHLASISSKPQDQLETSALYSCTSESGASATGVLPPIDTSRRYGRGKNPKLPAYVYGVPPPPLHRSAYVSVSARHLQAHEEFEALLTRSMSPRTRLVHASSYAPGQPTSARKPTPSAHGEPSQQTDLVDASAVPMPPPRRGESVVGDPNSSQQPAPLRLRHITDDIIRSSLRKLSELHGPLTGDCASSHLYRTSSIRAGSHSGSPLPSPRSFPSSPQHTSTTVGGRASSPALSVSSQSPRGSRNALKASTSDAYEDDASSNNDIAQGGRNAIDIPAAISPLVLRDKELRERLFERTVSTGACCGVVVNATLKKRSKQFTTVYELPVPKKGSAAAS